MKISVERVRRWMLAAAGLLVLVIAGYFFARNRLQHALNDKAKQALHDLGIDIISTTDNFTISQSGGPNGQTLYTIHAAKQITHRNGQMTLHNVSITMYGRKHDREDHISGSEFQYDQQAGTISAAGEVHIDLQAPQPEPKPGSKPKPPAAPDANGEAGNIIHVRAHGLVFWQKMGLAATKEPLDFQIHGITGSAIGAEYSSDSGLLVLQSEVKAAGLVNGRPIQLTASHAEFNRSTERAILTQLRYASQLPGSPNIETASADQAIVLLRVDGTPQHLDASGHVSLSPSSGVNLHSAKLSVDLDSAGQPRQLLASGSVQYAADEPLRSASASADLAHLWFGPHGVAQRLLATGKARLTQRTHAAPADPWIARSIAAEQIDAAFVPIPNTKQVQVSSILATGSARVLTQSTAAAKSTAASPVTTLTTLTAARIDTRLLDTPDGLAHLHGEGGARLQQSGSDGSLQDDRGETMDVTFRPQPPHTAKSAPAPADSLAGLINASLQGHVTISQTPARKPGDARLPAVGRGSAKRADFDASRNLLTLSGNAQWSTQGNTVWAGQIVTDRATGDADATGGIKASVVKEAAPPTADITHIVADHAHLQQSVQSAEFFGSSSAPARMWQGGSQVEAPILILEQAQQRLTARGNGPGLQVHSVFEGMHAPARAGGKPKAGIVRIASHELVYSDLSRQGSFTGGIQMDSADGSVTAQHADVWLQPATTPQLTSKSPAATSKKTTETTAATGMFSGDVDRVVASGRVRLTQPGRRGSGEQLVYTASDQKFVLTGTPANPPVINDQRGTSTGASLIFHAGDDSVEILGASPGVSSHEVHTETRVPARTRQ